MTNEVSTTLLQMLPTELWLRLYVAIAAVTVINVLLTCIFLIPNRIKRKIRQFKTWMWKTPEQHYGYYVMSGEVDSLAKYALMSKRDDHRWVFFSEKLWRDKRSGKWCFKVKGYRIKP